MNAIFINKVPRSFIGEHPNFYVTITMWCYDKACYLEWNHVIISTCKVTLYIKKGHVRLLLSCKS